MSTELLYLLLGIAGAIIMILFGIIGYFLKIVHADAKKAVEDCGKNKGKIELLNQKIESDVTRIEELTQLELRTLTKNVGELSDSVKLLVEFHLKSQVKSH